MLTIPKLFRFKCVKYLAWIRSQHCCVCGSPHVVPHHIIGIGRGKMGGKDHDYLTMPLCDKHHTELHQDPKMLKYQVKWLIETLEHAHLSGVIKVCGK